MRRFYALVAEQHRLRSTSTAPPSSRSSGGASTVSCSASRSTARSTPGRGAHRPVRPRVRRLPETTYAEAAQLRAEAMVVSDRWVEEGCDLGSPLLVGELTDSGPVVRLAARRVSSPPARSAEGAATSRAACSTAGPRCSTSRSPRATTPDAGLHLRHPDTGAATPVAPGCSSPRETDEAGSPDRARSQGVPGRAAVERVPRADPVRDVEVGPARLDHGDRQRLTAVRDREVSGGPDVLGEPAQRGQRGVAEQRDHPAGQAERAGARGPTRPESRRTSWCASRSPAGGRRRCADTRARTASSATVRPDGGRAAPGCAARGRASARSRRPYAAP
jgi:hypothetical protein